VGIRRLLISPEHTTVEAEVRDANADIGEVGGHHMPVRELRPERDERSAVAPHYRSSMQMILRARWTKSSFMWLAPLATLASWSKHAITRPADTAFFL
jgi:hypothetical protein